MLRPELCILGQGVRSQWRPSICLVAASIYLILTWVSPRSSAPRRKRQVVSANACSCLVPWQCFAQHNFEGTPLLFLFQKSLVLGHAQNHGFLGHTQTKRHTEPTKLGERDMSHLRWCVSNISSGPRQDPVSSGAPVMPLSFGVWRYGPCFLLSVLHIIVRQ